MGRFSQNLAAGREPGVEQVPQDFLLRINGDATAIGQILEVDSMRPPIEAQVDSVVDQPFSLKALAHSGFHEQIDRSLLEQASANSLLAILPCASLDHDRVDAVQMQKVREH